MSQQLRRIRAKLALDKKGGWIAGVCSGVARRLNVDAIYVRGAVVIAAVFFPKTVIVAYVLVWLLMHERKTEPDQTISK